MLQYLYSRSMYVNNVPLVFFNSLNALSLYHKLHLEFASRSLFITDVTDVFPSGIYIFANFSCSLSVLKLLLVAEFTLLIFALCCTPSDMAYMRTR